MKYISIFICSTFFQTRQLEAEDFKLEWTHYEDHLLISITAPSTGWVAVGFTEGLSIVGTNLVQGHVKNGKVFVQDQYVTGHGVHLSMESLGELPRIFDMSGEEQNGSTTLTFRIYKTKIDDFHYDLMEGNEIYVWLAYSVSDDFDHHSRKRIKRKITL